MTSLLRSIVAGPRLQHQEANLDLCYVSTNEPIIIAMSMPAVSFPKLFYRNPVSEVLSFLNRKHGSSWALWEFRAEGAGYDDADLGSVSVFHAPFPDHHPPPFALIPSVVASMRNHLHDGPDRVVVVHCKAGKGRSGTMSCAYLITELGMSAEESMRVFTAARMRPGFGEGVSIPSQRRWLGYVESWAREHERRYVDQRVRIHSVQIFGLRAGVRVAIRGFVEEGRRIQTVHVFRKGERRVVGTREDDDDEAVDVVLTPEKELWTPTSDVDVEFERRSSTTKYVVTSIAHVWFNAFFEGKGEQRSGVFEIEWAKLDGIKGTSRKGVQALEKLQVVWSVENEGKLVEEPAEGGEVQALGRAEGGSVGGESSRVEVEGEDIITDGDFVSEESGVESRESGEGQTGKKPVDNGDEAGKNLGESGKETGKNLGENGEGAGEKLKDGEETGKSLEDGEETRKKLEDGEETGKRPEETDKTPKKFGKKSKSNPKKTMEDLEETGPAEDGGKKFAENVTGKYGAKKLEEDREEDASNLEEAGPARNEGKKVEDVTMPVEGRNGTI